VLNTDNLSILGIAIDFGPYAFLDRSAAERGGNNFQGFKRFNLTAKARKAFLDRCDHNP